MQIATDEDKMKVVLFWRIKSIFWKALEIINLKFKVELKYRLSIIDYFGKLNSKNILDEESTKVKFIVYLYFYTNSSLKPFIIIFCQLFAKMFNTKAVLFFFKK